jgi:hypothetical protein
MLVKDNLIWYTDVCCLTWTVLYVHRVHSVNCTSFLSFNATCFVGGLFIPCDKYIGMQLGTVH